MMNKKILFISLLLVLILHVSIFYIFVLRQSKLQLYEESSEDQIYVEFFQSSLPVKIKNSPKINSSINATSKSKHSANIQETKEPSFLELSTKNNLILEQVQRLSQEENQISKNSSEGPVDHSPDLSEQNEIPFTNVLPISGKLSVLAYYGDYHIDSTPIGKGYLEVIYPNKSNYQIKLETRATGWASIFISKPLFFTSIGTISREGLSPKLYKENTPRRGESYVEVNKNKKTLFFSSTNKTINFKNKDLQDPLSLVFQLAWLSKKKTKIEFQDPSLFYVFNRKKITEIELLADLPEEIVLPGGILVEAIKIKSTVIKNKRPGIMSFWLDPSDNFLPIRISYKDKKSGKTLDFIVVRDDPSFRKEEVESSIKLDNQDNSHPYLPSY